MSDWISSEITLGLGSIALGMLAGRLCALVACWLPTLLEHQWQRDAREMLGLDVHKHSAPQLPRASRAEIWIVQIGCAGLSLMVTLHFGPTCQALFALPFTWCLLTLSLIDRQYHLLPDALVIPGLWAGLVLNSFGLFTALQDALWGCVIGFGSLWAVSQLTELITGRESIGRGDLKLLALMGAWGGLKVLGWTLVFSLLGAALAALFFVLLGKLSTVTRIPFGPFISAAGWSAFLIIIH
ncbi:prepilin peptidase [Pseudomonas huaxiensis]|uniref:prepilin peptidase n=1 Tax=Pseudomonas huaxiensis TaxID=2213017 RepID=UPI000DA6788C|nr:A24 family peptidase [Pseudomonas huaxiensis]